MQCIGGHLQSSGAEVIDADFSVPTGSGHSLANRFDAVNCMAVAGYLAHLRRALMENIRMTLRPGGQIVFEVPNVAHRPRRHAFFFRGNTVHSSIDEVYHSAVPFYRTSW